MEPNAEDLVAVPPALASMRRYALDGALLLFDRDTGLTAVCDGPETEHLRMRAPRVVQFAITNACNLACTFCSRDLEARSAWTADAAFEFLREMDRAGTLEVAFGGGEPLAFRGFVDLVKRLARETRLAVSLTTNGTRLTDDVARELAAHAGQVRVSVYDDVEFKGPIAALVSAKARFGINYLVTPSRLASIEARVLEFAARGCRDVLLLAYNGLDRAMHLTREQSDDVAARIAVLSKALRGRVQLKLDVCWGERMDAVPRLFDSGGCPAGREFIVVTSDRRLAPCSFHHVSYSIDDAAHALALWTREREALATAARDPGCARAENYGLPRSKTALPLVS